MGVGFIISLVIILGIQIGLQYLLYMLGLPNVAITIVIDLVLSILFSIFNFHGREKLKNPLFHRSIAIYFVVLHYFH